MLHLELGWIAHRLGELTDERRHYDDAASEFEWATDLHPEWPWAWYGLGAAEMAIGEQQGQAIENIKQMLGRDFLSRAANAFGRAARADPAFAQAVIDLATTAMRQRVHGRLEVARAALREAAATSAGSTAALQLAKGRVERETAQHDSALVAFERYVAAGGDSGVGFLERARTLFAAGRTAPGREAYATSARMAGSEMAVAMHRADIAWIATPAELQAFDSAGRGRDTWLGAFWSRRDLADGRRAGERLAEHYRRYFHALRQYRLVSAHRHYDITERYRSDQSEVDDRGVIYIRHGEPDRRATFTDRSVEPNESWMYHEPGSDRIFHFVARDDVQDFKLVESLADAYGLRVALALTGGASNGSAAALFESRSALDPVYQRLASMSPSSRSALLSDERSRGREAIGTGTVTDSYALRFKHPLRPLAREIAVGGSDGQTRLLVPFALSGSQLVAFERREMPVYPVELRIIAERSDGLIRSLDTIRTFSAGRKIESQEQLTGLLELDVPPGEYRVRLVVAQPEAELGGSVEHIGVKVPVLTEDTRVVSDLVVGRVGEGPFWLGRGDSIPVSAVTGFAEGANLSLYFEVHGLSLGERFHARIEIRQEGRGGFLGLFGGKRTPLSLGYDGVADGPASQVRQVLNVGQLKPGRYELRLVTELPPGDTRHMRAVSFTITSRKSA